MFRFKVVPTKPDEAYLAVLELTPWSGSINRPDEQDVETAKMLVDKVTQVAKQQHVKIVRADTFPGQFEMYEKCGFQRDGDCLLRVVLVVV